MGQYTDPMGLRVWNEPTDQISRNELAQNWKTINDHDHADGKGVPLPPGAFEPGSVGWDTIANDSILAGKLTDNSVVSTNIGSGQVHRGNIATGAVNEDLIEANAVTNGKIKDGAVFGNKIPDGGVGPGKLANNSVVTDTIASQAVTGPKVTTKAITGSADGARSLIADETIQAAQMDTCSVDERVLCDSSVFSRHLATNIVPVGTVIPWWRPSDLTPIPTGWEIAYGQTLLNADHDFAEATSITLPDLRNKFVLGAGAPETVPPTTTGTLAIYPPAIGSTGGPANHAVSANHSHATAHSHTVASHVHGISGDSHDHKFIDPLHPDQLSRMHQRGSGVHLQASDPGSTWRQGAYIAGINSAFAPNTDHDSGPIDMQMYSHNHGGFTDTNTLGGGTVTSTYSGNTGGPSTGATIDGRPSFVGLLFLIKVLNDPD